MVATRTIISAGIAVSLTIGSGSFAHPMATPLSTLTQHEEMTAELSARRGGGHSASRSHHVSRSHSVSRSRVSHSRNVNRNANRNVNRHVNRNVNRNVNRTVNRNVNVRRNVNVNVHGGAWRGGRYYWHGWARPGRYYWPVGGAIAAGAAIGFVTAATAVGIAATPAPAADMCWYYTDPSRTAGFWDVCP